jgi:hypothetical protein
MTMVIPPCTPFALFAQSPAHTHTRQTMRATPPPPPPAATEADSPCVRTMGNDDDDAVDITPRTRDEALRVLRLHTHDDAHAPLDDDVIAERVRAMIFESHPDRTGGTSDAQSRAQFRAVMRARDILRDRGVGESVNGGAGYAPKYTMAERAAMRTAENRLPRHFPAFIGATAVVLVGVWAYKTDAGRRKSERSPAIRAALGLDDRSRAKAIMDDGRSVS